MLKPQPFLSPLFTQLPRGPEPVEKPYSETFMSTWIGFRDPKSPFLEPNRGPRAGVGEFFNRLASSRQLGE